MTWKLKTEWKKIWQAPNYSVSNSGSVRNDNTGMVLSDQRVAHGYVHYRLSGREFRAHRLVAEAFIPNPKSLPSINHVDGNKRNNRVFNLEWCSQSHNVRHSYSIGLQSGRKGVRHHLSKLDDKKVREIRRLFNHTEMRQADIGKLFGINQQNVSLICSGKAWGHVKDEAI